MKNCKSPGNDGFTSEFFKFFWSDIGVFISRSLNYAYITDSLSVTHKQGIITCIPELNKSIHFLKNWRPISLLNVIYKKKKDKIKVKGVPQSQTAALPRPQEEEETDKSKQAQIKQTYEKH